MVDLPANVLINIFSQLDLPSLKSCSLAFSYDHSISNSINSILFKDIVLISTSSLDPNSQWADECLECSRENINGIEFRCLPSDPTRIFALVLVQHIGLLEKYQKFVSHITISCIDLSTLYLFGRTHAESVCCGTFSIENSSSTNNNNNFEINNNSDNNNLLNSSDSSISTISIPMDAITPPNSPTIDQFVPKIVETESIKLLRDFLSKLTNLKQIEVLCPCLRDITKASIPKKRIFQEKIDKVKSRSTLIIN